MLDLYLKDIPLLDAKSKTIREDMINLVNTLKNVLEDNRYDETIVRREKSITCQRCILTRQNMDNRLEFILILDKCGDFHRLIINKYFNQTSTEEEQTPTRIVHIDYNTIHGEGELTLNDIKEINSFLKQFFIDCFVRDLDDYIQQEYSHLLMDKRLSFNRSPTKDKRLIVFTSSLVPDTTFVTILMKEKGLIISSLNVGFGMNEHTREFYYKGVALDYPTDTAYGHIARLSDTPELMYDVDAVDLLTKTSISVDFIENPMIFRDNNPHYFHYTLYPTMDENTSHPIRYSREKLYSTKWIIPIKHPEIKQIFFKVNKVFFSEEKDKNYLDVSWVAVGSDEIKPMTCQINEKVYFPSSHNGVSHVLQYYMEENAITYTNKLLKIFE